MTFDTNRKKDIQHPYELVRISLPMVAETCTLGDGEGWYTPKTCQEPQTGFYQLWFATPDYDHMSNHFRARGPDQSDNNIYACIKSISETPAKLDPENGLAGRGSITITFEDFHGDPGPVRRTEHGKFFEKLSARNVMENGTITLYLGHFQTEIPVEADYQTKQYTIESLEPNFDGSWTLKGKDALYVLDKDETVWPPQLGGKLRQPVNETTTTIPVDGDTDYSSATWVRVGDEFMKVNTVNDNLTSSATLSVGTRGQWVNINGMNVSYNKADSHDAGDEVFICYEANDSSIADLLYLILTDVGVPSSFIPLSDWQDEMSIWHPTTRINTLFHTAESANDVITSICRDFLLDIWFDAIETKVKLSAISVWRESNTTVKEGEQITAGTLEYEDDSDMRYTRASVMYSMRNLTEGDSVENFRKLSVYVNSRAEDVYGKPRLRQLPSSRLLDRDAGDLLVQRYVSRFSSTPRLYEWETCERYLDFKLGDVVDIISPTIVGFDGLPIRPRAQILEIKPRYTKTGRFYSVEALAYEQPAGSSGNNEFTLSGRILNVDLFIVAGAPPEPVEVTFILNNITIGSSSVGEPAIRAGNFAAGSKINLVVVGKMSSKGGSGGEGGSYYNELGIDHFCTPSTDGGDGGVVYNPDGIDTDIYLAGTFNGINADGYLYAPGGGGKGGNARCGNDNNPQPANYGAGGGGGAGIPGGWGGTIRSFGYPGSIPTSAYGSPGQEDGTPGITGTPSNIGFAGYDGATWGQDSTYGLAGKGLIKTGTEVVNIFTAGDSTRFINGHGDAPDSIT